MINRIIELIPQNVYNYTNLGSDIAQKTFASLLFKTASQADSSIPFWSDQWEDTKAFNKFLYGLSEAGWLLTDIQPKKRFGTFKLNINKIHEYIDEQEFSEYRFDMKANLYTLSTKDANIVPDMVKLHSGIKQSGLQRPGMASCSTSKFMFDVDAIQSNYKDVINEVVKGMQKMAEKYPSIFDDVVNYHDIAIDIIDTYIVNPNNKYSIGELTIDSRGRAIYACLKHVFNPIGFKFARSLITASVTETITLDSKDAIDNIMLFVAEEAGNKLAYLNKSWKHKIKEGYRCYADRKLPSHGSAKVWISRIYRDLDKLYATGSVQWDIPIEADFTASQLAITGVLLNDKALLNATNVINDNDIQDAWNYQGITNRDSLKAVLTPALYGSSETEAGLLSHRNIEVEPSQMKLLKQARRSGKYASAMKLKDALISNARPQAKMILDTYYDQFTVECNKYRNVGVSKKAYIAWNSKDKKFKTFFNMKTNQVPDLARFRLFFATSLIHNLDSVLMDHIVNTAHWSIPIHDAYLALPSAVTVLRNRAVDKLNEFRTDRKHILNHYRNSIGAVGPKADLQFAKLLQSVEQVHPNTKFRVSCMK